MAWPFIPPWPASLQMWQMGRPSSSHPLLLPVLFSGGAWPPRRISFLCRMSASICSFSFFIPSSRPFAPAPVLAVFGFQLAPCLVAVAGPPAPGFPVHDPLGDAAMAATVAGPLPRFSLAKACASSFSLTASKNSAYELIFITYIFVVNSALNPPIR